VLLSVAVRTGNFYVLFVPLACPTLSLYFFQKNSLSDSPSFGALLCHVHLKNSFLLFLCLQLRVQLFSTMDEAWGKELHGTKSVQRPAERSASLHVGPESDHEGHVLRALLLPTKTTSTTTFERRQQQFCQPP
jgi:hypothetical protein